jgi:quercetin dioxygenase-like cupin family protein
MLLTKELTFGDLSLVILDFEYKNDELPIHVHRSNDSHITICVKGSVKVITDEWTKVLQPGNIIEFFKLQAHSITALEDASRVINIPKHNQI